MENKKQEINIEFIKKRMYDLGLSAYRIEKLTDNPHVYPKQVKASNLSRLFSSGGIRRPSTEVLKSLGLVLEAPWKNLLVD